MTDEAKRIVEWLRVESCNSCVFQRLGDCQSIDSCVNREIADLIESLAAELEQVKQERDGLNILLAQAQSMLETRTLERNAAANCLANVAAVCEYCAKSPKSFNCSTRSKCDTCCGWQWRGEKED